MQLLLNYLIDVMNTHDGHKDSNNNLINALFKSDQDRIIKDITRDRIYSGKYANQDLNKLTK